MDLAEAPEEETLAEIPAVVAALAEIPAVVAALAEIPVVAVTLVVLEEALAEIPVEDLVVGLT